LIAERRSPFSPEGVVEEFSKALKLYGVYEVTSDRYAGDWPVQQWKKYSVRCAPSERSKSEIYSDFLPLLNSGHVELLDSPRLVLQLANLERRTPAAARTASTTRQAAMTTSPTRPPAAREVRRPVFLVTTI
jgi:hypothetical protein